MLGAFRLLTGGTALLNLAVQGNELSMFCIEGKPMGAVTGNRLYDGARDLAEVGTAGIIYSGMTNPYAYSKVETLPYPNEMGIVVQGTAGVPMVPNGGVPAVSLPMNNPAVIASPAQLALPGGSGAGIGGVGVKVKPSNLYNVEAKPSRTVTRITDKMDEATRRYLIRENEAAENTKVRNVASTIEEKVIKKGQTERVVLNLDDWRGNVDELIKQLNDYPIEGLKEVIIVHDGTVQSIYP